MEVLAKIEKETLQVKCQYYEIQQQNLELRQELKQVVRDLCQESEHRDEVLHQNISELVDTLTMQLEQTQQMIMTQVLASTHYTHTEYPEELDDYYNQYSVDDALSNQEFPELSDIYEDSLYDQGLSEIPLLEESLDDMNPLELALPALPLLKLNDQDTNIPQIIHWKEAIHQCQNISELVDTLTALFEQTRQAIMTQVLGSTHYTHAEYPEELDDYHQYSVDDVLFNEELPEPSYIHENSLYDQGLGETPLLEESLGGRNPLELALPTQPLLELNGGDYEDSSYDQGLGKNPLHEESLDDRIHWNLHCPHSHSPNSIVETLKSPRSFTGRKPFISGMKHHAIVEEFEFFGRDEEKLQEYHGNNTKGVDRLLQAIWKRRKEENHQFDELDLKKSGGQVKANTSSNAQAHADTDVEETDENSGGSKMVEQCIPRIKHWKEAVLQWDRGDPKNGLTVPLSEWMTSIWYKTLKNSLDYETDQEDEEDEEDESDEEDEHDEEGESDEEYKQGDDEDEEEEEEKRPVKKQNISSASGQPSSSKSKNMPMCVQPPCRVK
ncbi:hypothetical protein BG000_004016 [Podila horticola]|nr:hypothetical protein BG000_004016 [Podila horticola]